MFNREKRFNIEGSFNRQNDRIWARSYQSIAKKFLLVHPTQVMVCLGVTWNVFTKINFCTNGVKTDQKKDQEEVLELLALPEGRRLMGNVKWCFQQDSAPARKAKKMQQW